MRDANQITVKFVSEPPTIDEGKRFCRKMEGYVTFWSGSSPILRSKTSDMLKITDELMG
jgi:hypothetical protein